MGTFSSLCASDKLKTKNFTGLIIHLSERRFLMKRLFVLFLVCSMILLSAGSVSAEESVVMPLPADTEVNTSWGVYLADFSDASSFPRSGSVKVSLYAQEMYSLADIDGLRSGSAVQIAGNVYHVSKVTPRQDGSVVIDGGEDSIPVVFKPQGEVYLASRNDCAVSTFVGTYTLTMPLPDAFTFFWMHSSKSIDSYTGDGFANLLSGGSLPALSRSFTVLSFSGGQPARLVFADFTVDNPEDAVHTASASKASPSGLPAPGPVYSGSGAGSGAGSFTLHPVVWDGVGLGKCAIPAGYEMNLNVYCNDDSTCFGAPFRFRVEAVSGSAVLGYFSSEVYVERVSGYYRQNNGAHDPELDVFMMTYMNASQYCDWVASRMVSDPAFWKEEDSSLLNGKVEYAKNYYKNKTVDDMASVGIKTNWYDVTAAQRVYTYQHNGETYALCILAEVRAFQMKSGVGVLTYWDIPEYFYMISSVSDFDRIHATDFQAFTSNTAFSDTFVQLQDDLTAQIRQRIEQGWARDIAYSNAYTAAMNALVTSSVESYLHSSSYSASDRFSDYIFDQNEYTTGDGYTCNISTSYDYVWDGGNGTVYYSNNALDMPAGATQLSPR